jgi:hypothetical protein
MPFLRDLGRCLGEGLVFIQAGRFPGRGLSFAFGNDAGGNHDLVDLEITLLRSITI